MTRIRVIPEANGDFAHFSRLVSALGLDRFEDDRLVLLGGYFGTGEDGAACLHFAKHLTEQFPNQVVSYLGSEEASLLNWLEDPAAQSAWLSEGSHLKTARSLCSFNDLLTISEQLDFVSEDAKTVQASVLIAGLVTSQHGELLDWLRELPVYDGSSVPVGTPAGTVEIEPVVFPAAAASAAPTASAAGPRVVTYDTVSASYSSFARAARHYELHDQGHHVPEAYTVKLDGEEIGYLRQRMGEALAEYRGETVWTNESSRGVSSDFFVLAEAAQPGTFADNANWIPLVPTPLLEEAVKAIDEAHCAATTDAPTHDLYPVDFERIAYDYSLEEGE